MREFQIGDLDGCLADDRWRRGFISDTPISRGDPSWASRFWRYHDMCVKDEYHNLDQLIPGVPLIILTGRPVAYAEQTVSTLRVVAKLEPVYILFRNNHDHRSSVEVKRDQLRALLNPNNNYDVQLSEIISAIDDREDIIQMYRAEGISNARVVRIGDEEHKHG